MSNLRTSTDLPASTCLGCGDKLDAVTATRAGETPSPGDATICLRCGKLMVFTRTLRLREPTKAERRKAAGDQWIKTVEAKRREIMQKVKH